jgi:hypothetical protein
MADIYTRIEGDPGYVANKIEITEDIEYLLTQIEVILFTEPTEVLGDKMLGADLEKLIFSTNVSAGSIEDIIRSQIRMYSMALSNTYNVDTRCEFYKGVDRDTAVLDITIDGTTAIGLMFA